MNKHAPSTLEIMSQLRLPLMLLVIYAHNYGQISEGYQLLSSGWDTYEVLKLAVSQTLAKVAVPVFFMMSGYLFFASAEQWDKAVYWQKIRRRAVTLLLPYLVWNALTAMKMKTWSLNCLWTYWHEAGIQTDWLGHQQLMTAPVDMPLWFLRDLMVVSLLTPIIYSGLRRVGGWLMAILTLAYLSGICAFTPGLSAYAVYFFCLGAWPAIRRKDLIDTCMRYERPAYAVSLLLAVCMMLTYGTVVFSSLMLAFRLTGAVAVFCLGRRILAATPRRLPTWTSRASYFVYLAHYPIMLSFIDTLLFRLFGTGEAGLSLHYLAAPPLKLAVLVTIYWLYLKAKPHYSVKS